MQRVHFVYFKSMYVCTCNNKIIISFEEVYARVNALCFAIETNICHYIMRFEENDKDCCSALKIRLLKLCMMATCCNHCNFSA